MKLTLNQLIASIESGALSRFASSVLPIKTSLAMKAVIRFVNDLAKDYHDTRLEICKRLGTINEKTNNFEFGDNQEAWNAEFSKLLALEVEIPGERLRLSKLPSSLMISPHDLEALDWLIDDGQPVAEEPPTELPNDVLNLEDQASVAHV